MADISFPFSLKKPDEDTPVTHTSEIEDTNQGKSQEKINQELYDGAGIPSDVARKEDIQESQGTIISSIGEKYQALIDFVGAKYSSLIDYLDVNFRNVTIRFDQIYGWVGEKTESVYVRTTQYIGDVVVPKFGELYNSITGRISNAVEQLQSNIHTSFYDTIGVVNSQSQALARQIERVDSAVFDEEYVRGGTLPNAPFYANSGELRDRRESLPVRTTPQQYDIKLSPVSLNKGEILRIKISNNYTDMLVVLSMMSGDGMSNVLKRVYDDGSFIDLSYVSEEDQSVLVGSPDYVLADSIIYEVFKSTKVVDKVDEVKNLIGNPQGEGIAGDIYYYAGGAKYAAERILENYARRTDIPTDYAKESQITEIKNMLNVSYDEAMAELNKG